MSPLIAFMQQYDQCLKHTRLRQFFNENLASACAMRIEHCFDAYTVDGTSYESLFMVTFTAVDNNIECLFEVSSYSATHGYTERTVIRSEDPATVLRDCIKTAERYCVEPKAKELLKQYLLPLAPLMYSNIALTNSGVGRQTHLMVA